MLLFTHPAMLAHRVPDGHAERPARLKAVLDALEGQSFDRREAPRADREHLERVHPARFLDALDTAFDDVGGDPDDLRALDPDTFVSPGTREAALRAAGANVAAVDAVLAGEHDLAFCAVRPPGHHAEPMRPMGFCVFNNVAIGAMHALETHGLAKVAIVDFDVHHGNGSQTIAEAEPRLLFASTHQSPLYPGTGAASETGVAGNVVNAPLPAGAGSVEWRRAMEQAILPALDAFAPDMILVSAGFDAHAADPLANMDLTENDYSWAGRRLREIALHRCKGRIVSTLEGGYDLKALAGSVSAYLAALRS